ncbi:nucleotidyltransferase domain-containing protein [candidate division KSB1 bacterium]|nr:nucleotidyltransferase domain-containing protein [candidate division KSB1 bacterium]
MRRLPKTPDEIFEAYVTDWRTTYGHELETIALYGSGARGEYVPGKSDLNFFVVLSASAINTLRRAVPLTEKWRRHAVAAPLVITRQYIHDSLDSFPIEFLNMKQHHRVIFGPEVLKDLEIPRGHLRLQLERDLKVNLLHLREGMLGSGYEREELRSLLSKSLTAFMPLFTALLFLRNEPLPDKLREVFDHIAQLAELDQSCFTELFRVISGETRPYRDEMWQLTDRYIAQIEKVTQLVDKM